jgi:hypothetical protein
VRTGNGIKQKQIPFGNDKKRIAPKEEIARRGNDKG